MKNIFTYARDKIKKKYENCYSYSIEQAKLLKESELSTIDFYEEKSNENIKEAIVCRLKAFWEVQSDDEKLFIGSGIAITLFVFFVFLYGIKNTPLNILVLNASESFFFCFGALAVVFLFRLFRKRIIKSKLFYAVWVFFLLLSIPHIPVLCGYETTRIGDFYEAEEYTEKYYVIMSKHSKEKTSRQVYRLPAEIERSLDYSYTTDISENYYSQEAGGEDVYVLHYHINRLFFPNGGYLTFDEPTCSIVQVEKETEVTDYYGDTYYITLTKEKVNGE